MVSLSPTKDSSTEEILQYDAGWAALNKLIRAGHSFSGKERNCAFLNLGTQKYANISSVTGLDLIDDGRGLAHCDWDWDGKLDFWTSNRTGPRIHFLHNRLKSENNFLAIRLKGTRSNRDAIGARVEIRLGKEQPPIIKTLYGGSGFLSQSSKWLHFGIGKNESIEDLRVNWPGEEPESFKDLRANNFYLIKQGSSEPSLFIPPTSQTSLTDTRAPQNEVTQTARVVLLNPAPMPEITYVNSQGIPANLDAHRGRPLLINLWTTWCPNCKAEMIEWGHDEEKFAAAAIPVLSLCADEPDDDGSKDHARILAAADAIKYPFPVGRIQGLALETLNVLQKSFIGKQSDLPLPSSLLIDAEGNLAVIYKGPVSVSRITADLELLGASPEDILAGATPFRGKWLTPPTGGAPRGVAKKLVEYGMRGVAADYLERIVPLLQLPDPDPKAEQSRIPELSQCHIFLGAIASDDNNPEKAIAHYRQSLALSPGNHDARHELIGNLIKLNRKAEALAETAILIENNPTPDRHLNASRLLRDLGKQPEAIMMYKKTLEMRSSAAANFELANLLNDAGQSAEAIQHYRASIILKPSWVLPANNLAWLLSTHRDPALRNGKEALTLATRICNATKRKIPHFLGTLAAANAETGNFEEAIDAIQGAVLLARSGNDAELESRFLKKLNLLERRMPIRDP